MRIAAPTLALNPLLVKELRGRMRGPRAFLFLTGVLLLLGLVSFGLFQLAVPRYFDRFGGGFNNAAAGSMIGQTMFVGLVFLTLLLVCAIAPSLTAGAISGEHQRKTFDLLVATPLTPFTILAGKLGAALSYVVLILLAAVPMTSLAYVFGGVTLSDLLRAFAVIGGFAIVFSVMGLFFSALFLRTGLAVGTSYFLLGAVMLGTFFVYAVVGVMRGEQPPNWILALNPFSTLSSALVDGVVTDPNMVYSGSSMTPLLYGLGGGRFDGTAMAQTPLWQYSAAIYTGLTLVLFALTTQLVKPVARFRFKWWVWAILLVLFILVAAALTVMAFPRRFSGLFSAWRFYTTAERNVVANNTFSESLATGWIVQAHHSENAAALPNPGLAKTDDGHTALRMTNPEGSAFREQTATQTLNVPLEDASMVSVRMVLRLGAHEVPVCGEPVVGTECPLSVTLEYTDRNRVAHKLTQGFFTTAANGFAGRCRKCERSPVFRQVNEDVWYAYDSGDLFEATRAEDMPVTLDRIVLRSRGKGYRADVAQVDVVVHEGRPLGYGTDPSQGYGWSWRSLVPSWVWDIWYGGFRGGAVQVAPAMPVPPPPMLIEKEPPVIAVPEFEGVAGTTPAPTPTLIP